MHPMTWRAAINICTALIEGNYSHVTHNTALLGGGVYLLGEKTRLETGSQAEPQRLTLAVDGGQAPGRELGASYYTRKRLSRSLPSYFPRHRRRAW